MRGKVYTGPSTALAPLRTGSHATPRRLARTLCGGWLPEGAAVLDPSCGDGELLLAAWEAAGHLETRLHGIELDPVSCGRARERLRATIGSAAGERAAAGVICADALDEAVTWPAGTHVLANPPWISYSGRGAPRALGRAAGRGAARSGQGWPCLHGEFLARIAQHVAEHATSARVLLPASVAELERYAPLRAAVTAVSRLSRPPVELGEHAFPDVDCPAVWIELLPGGLACSGASWTGPAARDEELLEGLRFHPRLPAVAFGDPGVHTGNAGGELVLRHADPHADPRFAGLREGRDLQDYLLGPPRAALRTDLPRTAVRRFRAKPLDAYRAVPILLRQTADRPRAALHTAPTYFRNSLLACTPPPGLDPGFVVGVLNSPVAAAWHRARHRDARQRTFPQVKVAHLRALPFPIAERGQAPALHDAVAERVHHMAAAGPDTARLREVEELVLAAYRLLPSLAEELRRAR